MKDGKIHHHYNWFDVQRSTISSKEVLPTGKATIRYGRHYLMSRGGGSGFFPLDVVLGLTRDRLSPWVMQWVARLATRMSFKAARMVCKAALNWAPATETIEQVVLGMGRDAAPFMKQLKAPAKDGEVLVIEVDGNRVGRRQEFEAPPEAAVSEGDLHVGCVSCGGKVVGVGPTLSQRRK